MMATAILPLHLQHILGDHASKAVIVQDNCRTHASPQPPAPTLTTISPKTGRRRHFRRQRKCRWESSSVTKIRGEGEGGNNDRAPVLKQRIDASPTAPTSMSLYRAMAKPVRQPFRQASNEGVDQILLLTTTRASE